MLGLTHFGHKGPLPSRLGYIEWGVVGEDCDTVKRTIIFREIHPALVFEVGRGLILQANTNHMGGRVAEMGGLNGVIDDTNRGRRGGEVSDYTSLTIISSGLVLAVALIK